MEKVVVVCILINLVKWVNIGLVIGMFIKMGR